MLYLYVIDNYITRYNFEFFEVMEYINLLIE